MLLSAEIKLRLNETLKSGQRMTLAASNRKPNSKFFKWKGTVLVYLMGSSEIEKTSRLIFFLQFSVFLVKLVLVSWSDKMDATILWNTHTQTTTTKTEGKRLSHNRTLLYKRENKIPRNLSYVPLTFLGPENL